MNKSKLAMAVIGGVAGLMAVGIGVMVWMQTDACDEKRFELDSQFSRQSANAAANPAVAEAHRKNEKSLVDWAKASYAFVGDRSVRELDADQEASAFKQQMMDEWRALTKLPADSDVKIIKETFFFGDTFKDFISQGSMPSAKDKPRLQREWDDLMHMMDIFLKSGVTELVGVEVVRKKSDEPAADEKRQRRRQSSGAAATVEPYPSSEETYVLRFTARPEALVKTLNAIASDEKRFMSASIRTFEQAGDPLVMMLGGGDKDKESRRGRVRRGRRAQEAEAAETAEGVEAEIARKGLVTNPETCEPFTVTLEVTTYDFVPAEAEEEVKK